MSHSISCPFKGIDLNIQTLPVQSTPYTYILEWTKQGKRYIGARWASGCHPNDLWSTYFTSSKYVAEFVAQYGAPDIILIDKIFDTAQEAMAREQGLQKQFDIKNNDAFLNKAIAGIFNFNDPDIRKKMSAARLGTKQSPEWIAWVTEFHRTRKRSADTGRKISTSRKGHRHSKATREKIRIAKLGRPSPLKGRPVSEERAAKLRTQTLGAKLSEEHKAKIKKSSHFQKDVKQERVECPHCGIVGGKFTMPRWHFNNCNKRR